jgi:hypothetical protein
MKKKRKKKGGAYCAVLLAGMALTLTGCKFVEDWAAEVPPQSGGDPAVPGVDPADGASVDPLDIAMWTLALLGLGPAARVVGAARPVLQPLLAKLFGKPKPATPAS